MRIVDLVLSGKRGGIDAGGTVGIIPTIWADWPRSSKLSADDDAPVFKGEYSSTLKSDSMSLAVDMDGTGGWSVETVDLRLPPVVLSTVTVTPLFP